MCIDKSGLACRLYCVKSSWCCFGCFPPALAQNLHNPPANGKQGPIPEEIYQRLSHEIDFRKFDKNSLVFEFFRGSSDFIMQKVYLLRLMPVCVGFIMVTWSFLSVPPITSGVQLNRAECKSALVSSKESRCRSCTLHKILYLASGAPKWYLPM